MAVAVLSDDAALFSKASGLFTATTTNYFRWGRDPAFSQGRTLGECTETLRVRGGRLTHRQREGGLCPLIGDSMCCELADVGSVTLLICRFYPRT